MRTNIFSKVDHEQIISMYLEAGNGKEVIRWLLVWYADTDNRIKFSGKRNTIFAKFLEVGDRTIARYMCDLKKEGFIKIDKRGILINSNIVTKTGRSIKFEFSKEVKCEQLAGKLKELELSIVRPKIYHEGRSRMENRLLKEIETLSLTIRDLTNEVRLLRHDNEMKNEKIKHQQSQLRLIKMKK